MSSKKNKKEEFIELQVESIGFNGVSVARNEGLVYFIQGGVPGDKLIAKILKKKKSYVECKVTEILEPSKHRVNPSCEHFAYCGGCNWQDFDYNQQVKWKSEHVKDSFTRLHKIDVGSFEPILSSEVIYEYRNKMEFSFADRRWLTPEEMRESDAKGTEISNRNFALGLHVRGAFDKILDLNYCHLQNENANKILNLTKKLALENNIPAHNVRFHEGLLRNLVIRYSKFENTFMVILITNPTENRAELDFVKLWADEIEKLKIANSIIYATKERNSPVKIINYEVKFGKAHLVEDILGVKYKISPFSFFQTNPNQLNAFIQNILDYSELDENESLWDLYCGTGSISLPAAKFVKKVVGLELVEESIKDAKSNSILNNIQNTEFYAVDLHTKNLPDIFNQLQKPDNIIIDPPRAGIHINVINHLLELEVKKLTYVSCNPTTMARDCELLAEKYEITKVKPVDMFPQTYHIEAIAQLRLKNL